MIVKNRDERAAGGVFDAAGERAERQMAFYLRRAFEGAADVFVLNDVRIPLDGEDAVQIDHLVIHKHGMAVIESKSVTSKVKINAQGEWVRLWDGHWKGMPSPLLQARRQADALRGVLQRHKEELRDRKIFGLMQGGFKSCPIDVFVAISDEGMFDERSKRPPGVLKAEAVPGALQELIGRHQRAGALLAVIVGPKTDDGIYVLTPDETARVCRFLMSRHTPAPARAAAATLVPPTAAGGDPSPRIVPPTPTPPPAQAARPVEAPRPVVRAAPAMREAPARNGSFVKCKHCGKQEGEAQWGKYGYYLRCSACGKNTGLERRCTACGKDGKIRKDGGRFWRECGEAGCGAAVVVWENGV